MSVYRTGKRILLSNLKYSKWAIFGLGMISSKRISIFIGEACVKYAAVTFISLGCSVSIVMAVTLIGGMLLGRLIFKEQMNVERIISMVVSLIGAMIVLYVMMDIFIKSHVNHINSKFYRTINNTKKSEINDIMNETEKIENRMTVQILYGISLSIAGGLTNTILSAVFTFSSNYNLSFGWIMVFDQVSLI